MRLVDAATLTSEQRATLEEVYVGAFPDKERAPFDSLFADDVLAVVDALGLDGCVAAGHSKGGASLLLAEERRPGTFAALWCFEPIVFPGGGPGPDGENPMAAGARRRRSTFPSRRA